LNVIFVQRGAESVDDGTFHLAVDDVGFTVRPPSPPPRRFDGRALAAGISETSATCTLKLPSVQIATPRCTPVGGRAQPVFSCESSTPRRQLPGKQRTPEFDGILTGGSCNFVDECLDEISVLRMADRAPEPGGRQVPRRYIRRAGSERVEHVADAFNREFVDAFRQLLRETGGDGQCRRRVQ
jgi:hypothetical protein